VPIGETQLNDSVGYLQVARLVNGMWARYSTRHLAS